MKRLIKFGNKEIPEERFFICSFCGCEFNSSKDEFTLKEQGLLTECPHCKKSVDWNSGKDVAKDESRETEEIRKIKSMIYCDTIIDWENTYNIMKNNCEYFSHKTIDDFKSFAEMLLYDALNNAKENEKNGVNKDESYYTKMTNKGYNYKEIVYTGHASSGFIDAEAFVVYDNKKYTDTHFNLRIVIDSETNF